MKKDLIDSVISKIEKRDNKDYLGTVALVGWNYSSFKKEELEELSEEQLRFLNSLTETTLEKEVNEIMTNVGGESPAYDLELVVAKGDIWIDIEFKKDGSYNSNLFTILM